MRFFKGLFSQLQGGFSTLLLAVNTICWTLPLFAGTFLKFIIPLKSWRRLWGRILTHIAENWIWCNNTVIRWTKSVKWDVSGLAGLNLNSWYLVISNHQSWLDIVVLQKIFYRRIPFLKFFLKKELIWVPFLGPAWWALDFPFMKRYSRAYLAKHPDKKGQDLEATRRACAKFSEIPVSVMNFVEGTRFTLAKARHQKSPYTHLLKPKAAGIAFVLGAMGDHINSILNVTITYPDKTNSLWAFMCGRVHRVKVVVEAIPVSKDLLGDYFSDSDFQKRFQTWLNSLWSNKDRLMSSISQ